MKKLIMLSLAAAISFGASAQLKIEKGGYAVFGKHLNTPSNLGGGLLQSSGTQAVSWPTPTPVALDSLAAAVFLGPKDYNRGGYIAFGGVGGVKMGEVPNATGPNAMMAYFYGPYGMRFESMAGLVFKYQQYTTDAVSSKPFIFYTDVRANSFIVDSDSRLKSNIATLEESANGLASITPVSYTLTSSVVESAEAQKLSDTTVEEPNQVNPVSPDSRTRYGFLAQEVQKVFPDLVIEDEDGTLGIDYIGFIPLLVDAVNTLQAKVEEQEKVIESLTAPQRRNAPTAGVDALTDDTPALGQNRPNPFTTTTQIDCVIPEGTANASLYVYDLQGKQLRNVAITDRGAVTLTLEADRMDAGMYIYSLIVDGAEIDSKRFIVTK